MNVWQFLDTNGDESGNTDMAADFSVTPGRYYFENPAALDADFHANRLVIQYSDAANQSTEEFGKLGVPLTNGIEISIRNAFDDALISKLTGALPIKANAHWARFCYDGRPDTYGAGTDDYVSVRWTLSEVGKLVTLQPGQILAFDLNDNLAGLSTFTANMQGHY